MNIAANILFFILGFILGYFLLITKYYTETNKMDKKYRDIVDGEFERIDKILEEYKKARSIYETRCKELENYELEIELKVIKDMKNIITGDKEKLNDNSRGSN